METGRRKEKLIIYGAGGLGKIILCDMISFGNFEPTAFTVDEAYLNESTVLGIPVVPFEEISELYPADEYEMLVVCSHRNMRARKEMYDKAKACGYHLINYISAGAFMDPFIEMGDNNIILAGARVGFGGIMGCDNIIRQNTYLGHEFRMGDHNILGIGCTIGGMCEIGDLSYFGLSVTAGDHRKFGDECLIGMGSVVTKDIDAYATAYGNPAKIASYHKETGIIVTAK